MEESNKNGAAPGIRVSPYPEGDWFSDEFNEEFNITKTSLTYSVFDRTIYDGTYADDKPDPDSETDGIIYIQYNKDTPSGIPDNFYAVRWEKLDTVSDPNTVWLSGCSDASGKSSLPAAEDEYTEANKDKYFQFGSDCHRGKDGKRIRPPRRPNEKPPFIKYLEEKTGKKFFD
jgi:hypothetical protein